MKNREINELDVIALLKEIPVHGLVRGDIGTVVTILSDSVYEVEFMAEHGVSKAVIPVTEKDIMKIHFERLPV